MKIIIPIGIASIILGLYATQFAFAQFDIEKKYHDILDQCTPYSINGKGNETHIERNLISPNVASMFNITHYHEYNNVTNPCSQSMMNIKTVCDRNLLDPTGNICSDPRYQD